MPAISVLMPVYNAAPFIKDAIESILKQSFVDFEFLIFNDGSTDNSHELINGYNDARIKVFHFENNQGYVEHLNTGIKEAKGKYIARMDADDVAHPERLRKQFDFLEAHADYVICGSRFEVLGSGKTVQLPLEDDDIKLKMLYITPFCHPAVMLRSKVLFENNLFYNVEHSPSEDLELWIRLTEFGKFHNLEENLLYYRVHQNNISLQLRSDAQRKNLKEAQEKYIEFFFKEAFVNYEEVQLLYNYLFQENGFNKDDLIAIGTLLQKIIGAGKNYPVKTELVHSYLSKRYVYCCLTSTHLGLKSFLLANHYKFVKIPFYLNIKLLVKSVLRYSKSNT